jgi:hypothetical protein
MTPRAVVTLAAVALWAGGFVSEATATGPCNKKVCAEEIAAGCAGLKGMALSVCTKAVLLNCDTTACSCTDPTLPACTPTTTSSTTTTSTSTTTTTTTTPPIQCCVQSSSMGAFDTCVLETAAQCSADGGISFGAGTCSPNPCPQTAPVCGNGIREPGEQCDGGPACTSNCLQGIPACCSLAPQCLDASGFILFLNLSTFCSVQLPGSTPIRGGICQADGSCTEEAIEPVPVCCQLSGSCNEQIVTSTGGLWVFRNSCVGAQVGTVVVNAACGADGSCVPQ